MASTAKTRSSCSNAMRISNNSIDTAATSQLYGNSTVFTLPSPPKRKMLNAVNISSDQNLNQLSCTPGGGINDSYEEFPNHPQSPQSPSLPWLVEYWSSTLLRAPAMIIDQMCACSSNLNDVDGGGTIGGSGTTSAGGLVVLSSPTPLDESHRIDINDPTGRYFDDVILASQKAPPVHFHHQRRHKPMTMMSKRDHRLKNHFHRKTKSLTDRWDQLRSVVASHDDSMAYDYYEDVVMSASYDDPRYPSKKHQQHHFTNYRQSSIVVNSDDEDEYDEFSDDQLSFLNPIDAGDDDDVRMAPPEDSPSPSNEDEDGNNNNIFLHHQDFRKKHHSSINKKKRVQSGSSDVLSNDDSYEYMDINTCHSFDQYIDTTKYLCANSESSEQLAPPPTTPVAPPRGGREEMEGRRRPSSRSRGGREEEAGGFSSPTHLAPISSVVEDNAIDDADIDRITPLRTIESPVRHTRIRTPPSPAPSTNSTADTYTTISLTQSFAKEFEDDFDESPQDQQQHQQQRGFTLPPAESSNSRRADTNNTARRSSSKTRRREIDVESVLSGANTNATMMTASMMTTGKVPAVPSPSSEILSTSSSSSFEDDIKNGNLFLDRLAAEQLLSSTTSTTRSTPIVSNIAAAPSPTGAVILSKDSFASSSSNNKRNSSNSKSSTKNKMKKHFGSPFRRLRPRSSNNKMFSSASSKKSKSFSEDEARRKAEGVYEGEGIEINDENLYPATKIASSSSSMMFNNSKSLDDEDIGANHAYRYLIRMNPQNYKHSLYSTFSETSTRSINAPTSGNNNEVSVPSSVMKCGGGVYQKYSNNNVVNNNYDVDDKNEDDDVLSPSTSAVLLPLHPDQRIIDPLPHQDSTFDDDNSAYTYFRDTLRRQHIAEVQGIEEMQQQQQTAGQPTSGGYFHQQQQQQPEPQPIFPTM